MRNDVLLYAYTDINRDKYFLVDDNLNQLDFKKHLELDSDEKIAHVFETFFKTIFSSINANVELFNAYLQNNFVNKIEAYESDGNTIKSDSEFRFLYLRLFSEFNKRIDTFVQSQYYDFDKKVFFKRLKERTFLHLNAESDYMNVKKWAIEQYFTKYYHSFNYLSSIDSVKKQELEDSFIEKYTNLILSLRIKINHNENELRESDLLFHREAIYTKKMGYAFLYIVIERFFRMHLEKEISQFVNDKLREENVDEY